MRPVKYGDVWHTRRHGYRRVLWTSRYFVAYAKHTGKQRMCSPRAFQRWIAARQARRAQRNRRRELSLAA